MGAFYDIYLPSSVPGYPCLSSPSTSTTITVASSGDEGRNRNWSAPLLKFKLPAAQARQWDVIEDLISHFRVLDGPYASFAFRDPHDFASISLKAPNEATASVLARITLADQALGTGDGVTRTFQLAKTYVRGAYSKVRPIEVPVTSSLKLGDNGAAAGSYVVTRPGGLVTFAAAPLAGHALTWGGLFDVAVRFDSDDALDAIIQAYQASGFAEINLQETRIC